MWVKTQAKHPTILGARGKGVCGCELILLSWAARELLYVGQVQNRGKENSSACVPRSKPKLTLLSQPTCCTGTPDAMVTQ